MIHYCSNVLQKQLLQALFRLDIETIMACFIISFVLEIYTRRTDQQTWEKPF